VQIADAMPLVLGAGYPSLLNARMVWKHYVGKCAAARSSCRVEFSNPHTPATTLHSCPQSQPPV